MRDQDDDVSIDEAVLEDVGRWRRDQQRIDAYGTPAEGNEEIETLTEEQREEMVARLSSRHLTAVPQAAEDEALVETTGAQDASSRTMLTIHRRPRPPRWRLVASHGIAAGIAATIVFAVVARPSSEAEPGDQAPRFDRVRVLGTSASSHLGDDDEWCPDALAHVRIEPAEGAPASVDTPLEVIIHSKTASGPSHWEMHRLDEEGSPWTRSSDGSLFFEGPLSSLVPLRPGDWTLGFHVGPRGACGPSALPSCRALPTVVVRVASAAACHAKR